VIDNINVGTGGLGPTNIAYNLGNGNMYMTDEGSGSVYIINYAHSVIDTINV